MGQIPISDIYGSNFFIFNSSVNDVIADKNVVTNIMSNSTGLQHIGFNGFVKRHWKMVITPLLMVGD